MKAWVFGDDIDTDVIAPGRYMKFGIDEIAKHCLESVTPSFASSVKKGDFVIGGRNFGPARDGPLVSVPFNGP